MAAHKKVLVVGASGLVGGAVTRHFAELRTWQTVSVSRRLPSPPPPGVELVSLDVADEGACARVIGEMTDVTHLVYAAQYEAPGLAPGWFDPEAIAINDRMLRNVVEPLSAVAGGLEHLSILHGTKAYGMHHPELGLNGLNLPLRERDPRRVHPSWYFAQEDYMREKQRGASWAITFWRPALIFGDTPGVNMSLLPPIGIYAALEREQGRPLSYPGVSYEQISSEAMDVDLLAHAMSWAATAPTARDRTFNLTNGDTFGWRHVWPVIAETMGMELGGHEPMSFAEDLPKRDDEWAALVDRYGLDVPRSIVEYAGANSLAYADILLGGLGSSEPILNSTVAVRQAGFDEYMDTEDMFRKWFGRMQETGALPKASRPASEQSPPGSDPSVPASAAASP